MGGGSVMERLTGRVANSPKQYTREKHEIHYFIDSSNCKVN